MISEKIHKTPDGMFERISRETIFFGHQSVGKNILQGLAALQNNHPRIRVNVLDYPERTDGKVFLHAPIGRNEDPESKITGFVEYMNNGLGEEAGIAFFKFCYVDIKAETNVGELLQSYKRAMDELARTYPRTKFLHTTVPLTVVQKGPKAWIKKTIGRPIGGYADNIQRNRYNELLRQTYGMNAPLFDIAAVEATLADGSKNQFNDNGKKYDALVPEYASDGRHLNNIGSRLVAAEMLLSMARVLDAK